MAAQAQGFSHLREEATPSGSKEWPTLGGDLGTVDGDARVGAQPGQCGVKVRVRRREARYQNRQTQADQPACEKYLPDGHRFVTTLASCARVRNRGSGAERVSDRIHARQATNPTAITARTS